MTTLSALPLLAPFFRLIDGEDWRDSVLYATEDGAPFDVSPVAFNLQVFPRGQTGAALTASTAAGTIVVSGACVAMNVAASAMAALTPGPYEVLMTGAEAGETRVLFAGRLAMVQSP